MAHDIKFDGVVSLLPDGRTCVVSLDHSYFRAGDLVTVTSRPVDAGPPSKVFFWGHDGVGEPKDYIKSELTFEQKQLAITLARGQIVEVYRGMAQCRICNRILGCADLVGHGFTWPEMAEHYIIRHSVWPPGADELLTAAFGRKCDDCNLRRLSDDLITKGDHHGGQKTVCRDRDACHRRSPG